MCQRLLFHIAQVVRTTHVARLAPAGAVPHAGVVIHLLVDPARGAGMACIAVHRRTVEQLNFGNVIAGFGQGALVACGQIAAVVA